MFLHFEGGLHKEDKPLLRGDDIRRYGYKYKGEFVWYVPARMRKHRSTARPGESARFEQPKVLVKDTTKDFSCTFENSGYYVKDVLIVLHKSLFPAAYDLKFLAGVINSKLLRFFYRTTFNTIHVQNGELASLPLPPLDLRISAQKEGHDRLVVLVGQMLDAEERRASSKTDAEASYYDARCSDLDAATDRLVAELYGVTEKEFAIVDRTIVKMG